MKVICEDKEIVCMDCAHGKPHEGTPNCKLLCDFKGKKCKCVAADVGEGEEGA